MSNKGVVSGDAVRLRGAPVDGSIIREVSRGTPVEIEDTWHKVIIDGARGWISSAYVKEDQTGTTDTPVSAFIQPTTRDESIVRIMTWATANTSFISDSPIQVDESFFPAMTRIERYAMECGVKIVVTNSFRCPSDQLTGTVVVPSKCSNHLVGHAIDMNVQANGRLWRSVDMVKSSWSHLPQSVIDFLNKVRRDGQLRWGGDFVRPDTVHIDDDLWRRDSTAWMQKYRTLV